MKESINRFLLSKWAFTVLSAILITPFLIIAVSGQVWQMFFGILIGWAIIAGVSLWLEWLEER